MFRCSVMSFTVRLICEQSATENLLSPRILASRNWESCSKAGCAYIANHLERNCVGGSSCEILERPESWCTEAGIEELTRARPRDCDSRGFAAVRRWLSVGALKLVRRGNERYKSTWDRSGCSHSVVVLEELRDSNKVTTVDGKVDGRRKRANRRPRPDVGCVLHVTITDKSCSRRKLWFHELICPGT